MTFLQIIMLDSTNSDRLSCSNDIDIVFEILTQLNNTLMLTK